MIKENNQMYKIAIIDNETELFSILDEQKDVYKDYSWFHFKSINKLIDTEFEENFSLYVINDTIINDESFKHIEAIIGSMTPKERSQPNLLNYSRKNRIARGSGRDINEVNQLIKQFGQMSKMMKMMQGGKGKQMMQMLQGFK